MIHVLTLIGTGIVIAWLVVLVLCAVAWVAGEHARRARLRRMPRGRMVPIESHPRFNDRRAS